MQVEFDPDEPVTLEVLDGSSNPALAIHVVSVCGRTLKVQAPAEMLPGAAVRIHSPRYVLLSEVTDIDNESGVVNLAIRYAFAASDVDTIQQRWR